jgi:hypothetical protein
MLIGIRGTGVMISGVALPLVGAVCGRLSESFLLNPPTSSVLGSWRDAGFQSRLCSHFFAVSCLLSWGNVSLLVPASIVLVASQNVVFKVCCMVNTL